MYCPNCGEELPDDYSFCPNCGTEFVPSVDENKPAMSRIMSGISGGSFGGAADPNAAKVEIEEEPETFVLDDAPDYRPKKKHRFLKGFLIFLLILAIAAGTAFAAYKMLEAAASSDTASLTVIDGTYTMIPNMNRDKTVSVTELTGNVSADDVPVLFSPDGTYVYYMTDFAENGTGSLYRAEYAYLREGVAKNANYITLIGEEVVPDSLSVYCDGAVWLDINNNLTIWNGSETAILSEGITELLNTDEEGRILYTTGSYDSTIRLLGIDEGSSNEPNLIAENFTAIWSCSDLEHIIYTTTSADDGYVVMTANANGVISEIGRNGAWIASGASDGSVYFAVQTDSLCLYDYVVDETAEADAAAEEPKEEDFGSLVYNREMVEDENLDYSDLTLYTSTTLPLWWLYDGTVTMSEAAVSERAIEYDEETGDPIEEESTEQDAIAAALQSFITTYGPREDADGYILVDDEVRAALEAIIRVAGNKDDTENSWLLLCYADIPDPESYDFDGYNAAVEAYEQAQTRIALREGLKNSDNDRPVYTLYHAGTGAAEIVADKVLSWGTYSETGTDASGAVLYNTVEMISQDDYVPIDDLEYANEVSYLFTLDTTARNYIVPAAADGADSYRLSDEAAQLLTSEIKSGGGDLRFSASDAGIYLNIAGESLYRADTDGVNVLSFSELEENAVLLGSCGTRLWLASELSGNSGTLSACENGTLIRMRQTVLINEVTLYENGMLLAYTDDFGSCVWFNADGTVYEIAEGTSDAMMLDDTTVLWLDSVGLHLYNGAEETVPFEGVSSIWVLHPIDVLETLSYEL